MKLKPKGKLIYFICIQTAEVLRRLNRTAITLYIVNFNRENS